jgi:flagellar basal body-associated protein FliL
MTKRALLLGVPVLLVAGVAVGVIVARSHGGHGHDPVLREATVQMPEMTVNLAGGDGYSYLRVQIAVQVRGPMQEDALTQAVDSRRAALLDVVNALSQETMFTQIRTSQGRQGFEQEIASRFQALLGPSVRVERIYFEEFVAE